MNKNVYNRVLIAEDEKNLLVIMSDYFEGEGFDVTTVTDGKMALEMWKRNSFDLIILDIKMPIINGIDVCKGIREKDKKVPIIFVTARVEEQQQIEGMNVGATDYVTKPFSLGVLVKKCESLIRLYRCLEDDAILSVSGVKLDLLSRKIIIDEYECELDNKEFLLLKLLMEKAGYVLPRDAIYFWIWNDSNADSRIVDTYIKRLRKKLGPKKQNIRTFAKEGYRYEKI